MSAFLLWLALTGGAAQSAPAPADWQWNPNTPVCRLQQQTLSGGSIEVTRTPGNEETEVTVISELSSSVREGQFPGGSIGLHPNGKAAADVTLYVDDQRRVHTYAVSQDVGFMQSFRGATGLEISHPKATPARTVIRSAAAAAEVLQACEDQKMREWGIDPVAWRALKSRPVPLKPVRSRFRDLDYPAAALAQGLEADAVTLLDVGPDGRVKHCKSINSGGYKAFEEAACKVLKGARFRPASNDAGVPVSAPYVFDVRFRIAR